MSKSKGTIQDIVNRNFWLPDNGRLTAFVNTGTWNGPNGSIEGGETFAAEIHYSDDAMTWKNLPVILTRIHGNPLDTLIWSQTDQGDFGKGNFTTGAGERITFVARITGKMDKSGVSLQTGTVKSLAGYHIELSPNDPEGPLYDASALTMPGNLIIPATFCKSTTNQQYLPCRWRTNRYGGNYGLIGLRTKSEEEAFHYYEIDAGRVCMALAFCVHISTRNR